MSALAPSERLVPDRNKPETAGSNDRSRGLSAVGDRVRRPEAHEASRDAEHTRLEQPGRAAVLLGRCLPYGPGPIATDMIEGSHPHEAG